MAKNRHGLVEHFPIATLSVAAITNQSDVYDSMDKLSQVISETKRECKQQGGNYYLIRNINIVNLCTIIYNMQIRIHYIDHSDVADKTIMKGIGYAS